MKTPTETICEPARIVEAPCSTMTRDAVNSAIATALGQRWLANCGEETADHEPYVRNSGLTHTHPPFAYTNFSCRKCDAQMTECSGESPWEVESYECSPDYFNDLNACAGFEATLSDGELIRYEGEVKRISFRDWNSGGFNKASTGCFSICATAPQRCEAFLSVKGLEIKGSSNAQPSDAKGKDHGS